MYESKSADRKLRTAMSADGLDVAAFAQGREGPVGHGRAVVKHHVRHKEVVATDGALHMPV